MTYEEALDTCRMALKALSMKHPDPMAKKYGFYDEDIANKVVKEISEKYEIQTIMNALEKQIPKKPKVITTSERVRLEELVCPSCHKFFGEKIKGDAFLFPMPKYCECCGQIIDWMEVYKL